MLLGFERFLWFMLNIKNMKLSGNCGRRVPLLSCQFPNCGDVSSQRWLSAVGGNVFVLAK